MSNFCGWLFCLVGLAGRKGFSGVLLCFVLKASENPWGTHFCEIAHGRVPPPNINCCSCYFLKQCSQSFLNFLFSQ